MAVADELLLVVTDDGRFAFADQPATTSFGCTAPGPPAASHAAFVAGPSGSPEVS